MKAVALRLLLHLWACVVAVQPALPATDRKLLHRKCKFHSFSAQVGGGLILNA